MKKITACLVSCLFFLLAACGTGGHSASASNTGHTATSRHHSQSAPAVPGATTPGSLPPPATPGETMPESGAASSAALPSVLVDSYLALPGQWQGEHPAELARGWHASISMPSSYADRYLFLEDGTFYFSANGMTQGVRLRYMDGTWHCENGMVYLQVQRKIVIEGGELVDGEGSTINRIAGGQHVLYDLPPEEYETRQLEIQVVLLAQYEQGEYGYGRVSILLEGQQFWSSIQSSTDDGEYIYNHAPFFDMLTLWEDYEYAVQHGENIPY